MRPPIIVTSSLDVAAVLREDREAMGITGEEFDARIGWSDRYTAKAESPRKRWGKNLINVHPMGDLWLIGLNRALLLVDRSVADAIVRDAPKTHEDIHHRLETVRVARWTYR